MGCASCSKQRSVVRQSVQNRQYKKAAVETLRGAAMMAGVLPKAGASDPATPRKPGEAPKHILTRQPFSGLFSTKSTNAERGFNKKS